MSKVKAGYFSFTEITDPNEHRSYNEWHQLDHMPEQYPLRGIVFGQRWVSTPACQAAREVDEAPLQPVHYITLYLMTEPVEETLQEFMALGQRLREVNRFHAHRRSHLSAAFEPVAIQAAARVLISAEAVPYRPNLGVYVIVEELAEGRPFEVDLSELVATPGVAGAWAFGSGARQITVCYLDADPLKVADELRPALAKRWGSSSLRPIFCGPLETIMPWHWDWFDQPAEGRAQGQVQAPHG
jgi:hypothetical protein